MMLHYSNMRLIIPLLLISIFILIQECSSIRCYQCASSDDEKGDDKCGAYSSFDAEDHVAVDCSGDEAVTPGTFCMKVVQQGPKGFIWDGRWRQVIRRCSSVADTGVTGVCNWGVHENGIYWEECYCGEDGCNSANSYRLPPTLLFSAFVCSLFLWLR